MAAPACRCAPPAAILEEIHAAAATRAPATRRCTSWARCCGTAARSRSSGTCPKIASGELRLQAFGVTEPTTGSDTTKLKTRAVRDGDHYVVNGQKVWTSRALHSDLMLLLARTTPLDEVSEEDRRPVGVPGRHARGARQGHGDPPARGDDQPQHHRDLLRQPAQSRPRT